MFVVWFRALSCATFCAPSPAHLTSLKYSTIKAKLLAVAGDCAVARGAAAGARKVLYCYLCAPVSLASTVSLLHPSLAFTVRALQDARRSSPTSETRIRSRRKMPPARHVFRPPAQHAQVRQVDARYCVGGRRSVASPSALLVQACTNRQVDSSFRSNRQGLPKILP